MHDITEDFYRQLGQLIQEKRKRKSLTQEAVANLLGISRATFANLEAGEHRLLLHHLLELNLLLEVDLQEVASLYNKMKLSNQIASTSGGLKDALDRLRVGLNRLNVNEATL